MSDIKPIFWDHNSPPKGAENCTCSICWETIEADDQILRVTDPETGMEARFHWNCAIEHNIFQRLEIEGQPPKLKPWENDPLYPSFAKEVNELAKQAPFTITLDGNQTWVLIGLLQLVLRHPDLPAYSRRVAEQVGQQIELLFQDYPTIKLILERGWHSEYDQPIE